MSLPDIRFSDHGTIWLTRPLTDAGWDWIEEHVAIETWFGGAGVIEHRYARDIVEGAARAGLNVEVA